MPVPQGAGIFSGWRIPKLRCAGTAGRPVDVARERLPSGAMYGRQQPELAPTPTLKPEPEPEPKAEALLSKTPERGRAGPGVPQPLGRTSLCALATAAIHGRCRGTPGPTRPLARHGPGFGDRRQFHLAQAMRVARTSHSAGLHRSTLTLTLTPTPTPTPTPTLCRRLPKPASSMPAEDAGRHRSGASATWMCHGRECGQDVRPSGEPDRWGTAAPSDASASASAPASCFALPSSSSFPLPGQLQSQLPVPDRWAPIGHCRHQSRAPTQLRTSAPPVRGKRHMDVPP